MVQRLQILVIAESPIPLEKAETADGVDVIRTQPQLARIAERPPDPFAGGALHEQAVGIVHLRTEVVEAADIPLAVQKHSGERRQTELRDILSQKQMHLHRHPGGIARGYLKPIGADGAAPVAPGAERDAYGVGGGRLAPKL